LIDYNSKRIWGPQPNYPTVKGFEKIPQDLIAIAGPCSIEDEYQMTVVADLLSRVGVSFMRGGVYRAGTYPPKDIGLRRDLLSEWTGVAKAYDLKIIVEVLDIRELEYIDLYADAFQVGARHMQDYALLNALSETSKTVTIKRGTGATLDEFLGAVEYLVRGGKKNVIMIERGSVSHMDHVRWDLSVSTIAAIKRITGIPILVDASHGTGRRDLVESLTLAGIAAGADGFLLEIHPKPSESLSDAEQAMPLTAYEPLLKRAKTIRGMNGD